MASPDYDPDAILADPDAHPVHKVYAAINIGIRDRGEHWAKCPNCGEPYQLTERWGDSTVCSQTCAREYTAYVMGGGLLSAARLSRLHLNAVTEV